jgi:SAM-dependent methyltransferase
MAGAHLIFAHWSSADNEAMSPTIQRCSICHGTSFTSQTVIWDGLASDWELSGDERALIDRQQGTRCDRCGCNLRSIALAKAITTATSHGQRLYHWLASPWSWRLRVLELNGAGDLTRWLRRLPRRTAGHYPEVDMQKMNFAEGSFDLVLHSDTLEHVPDPLAGLRECCRVLRPGGWCCFTIPIVTRRLTRSRKALPPSYHGQPHELKPDFTVHTEFGSDFWELIFEAGFEDCHIVTAEFPAAQAIVARRPC